MTRSVGLAGLVAAGCMGPWPLQQADSDLASPDAGFVFIGPVDLYGPSRAHDEGRRYLEELGVVTSFTDLVEPPDAEAAIGEQVDLGREVVFATAREFDEGAEAAGTAHPEVDLLAFEGHGQPPNQFAYSARMYQAIWLAGVVAGATTETDHVAVVASIPNPEHYRNINAFALGVHEVRPTAVVEVAWTLMPVDPAGEAAITDAVIDHGADVVLAQTDTPIPLETADGRTVPLGKDSVPVRTIGYHNADVCDVAPTSCMTAAFWNWGPVYAELFADANAGALDPERVRWDPLDPDDPDSAIALADLAPQVAPDAALAVDEAKADLRGPADPFVGPLVDDRGVQRAGPGEPLDDGALLDMCWYVEGVMSWDLGSASLVPAVPVPCGPGGGGPPPGGP